MEEIIQYDKQLLLMVNGSDSLFMDYLILTLTNAKTWIPLYIGLFYVVLKTNKNVRDVLLILAAAGLCYLLAGAVDDGIVKPLVARWRPPMIRRSVPWWMWLTAIVGESTVSSQPMPPTRSASLSSSLC